MASSRGPGPLQLERIREARDVGDSGLDVDVHPSNGWLVFIRDEKFLEVWNFRYCRLVARRASASRTRYLVARFLCREAWVVVLYLTIHGYGMFTYSIKMDVEKLGTWEFITAKKCFRVAGPSGTLSQMVAQHHSSWNSPPLVVHSSSRYILTAVKSSVRRVHSESNAGEWDIERFEGQPEVTQLSFHPVDSEIFASGSRGGAIRLRDHGKWFVLQTDEARNGISSMEFCSDRQKSLLITGSHRGKVQIWDYKDRVCVKILEVGGRWEYAIARFHPVRPYIVCALQSGRIEVYDDGPDYKPVCSHPTGLGEVWTMVLYREAKRLIVGGRGAFLIMKAYEPDPHPAKMVKMESISEQGTQEVVVATVQKKANESRLAEEIRRPHVTVSIDRLRVGRASSPSGSKHEKPDEFNLGEAGMLVELESEDSGSDGEGKKKNQLKADASDWVEETRMPTKRFAQSGSRNKENEIIRNGERVKVIGTGVSNVPLRREVPKEGVRPFGSTEEERERRETKKICPLEIFTQHRHSLPKESGQSMRMERPRVLECEEEGRTYVRAADQPQRTDAERIKEHVEQ
ncbi:hypothetical protein CBR_g36755 [Chara braunii]|uniref:Uncharacterized protein n=1 Tax=Chara braunii TaxID=69332 RepID=A0A388LLG7_CHABU|nr:hypothetical protein CBR_g36755 [Chara braunii]|eukprot:GBG83137.1 hypothetical protein CBR_g36755 [Chara braunii]